MSSEPRQYRLYQTLTSRVIMTGIPIIMGIAGVGGLIFILSSTQVEDPAAVAFFVVWLGFIGFVGYQMLRMPSVIEWHGDGTVSFRGPIRTVRVPVSEIQSIKPAGNNGLGFLEVRFAGRKLQFLNQFDDFHDFLLRLKAANAQVELRGC